MNGNNTNGEAESGSNTCKELSGANTGAGDERQPHLRDGDERPQRLRGWMHGNSTCGTAYST